MVADAPPSSVVICLKKLKQFRYVAYIIMLLVNFQETISRFGMPMAMVGGFVKQNCSDPLDNGTYCWSEDIKANALGAFFYTYCLQIPVTMVARKIGFSIMLKVYMITSALMIGGIPYVLALSCHHCTSYKRTCCTYLHVI